MRLKVLVVLSAVLVAAPAAADDLIYHAKSDHPDVLSQFDGQPYWKPLARCAGIYSAVEVALRGQGKSDLADLAGQEKTALMSAYANRVAKDRGLSLQDALAVPRDFNIDSAVMMGDVIKSDPDSAAELMGQCEKTYNIVAQETAGQ